MVSERLKEWGRVVENGGWRKFTFRVDQPSEEDGLVLTPLIRAVGRVHELRAELFGRLDSPPDIKITQNEDKGTATVTVKQSS